MYVIRDLPRRGKGLVATETIPRGTRILCEEPMIVITESESDMRAASEVIVRQVSALDTRSRERFLALHNIHPFSSAEERYMGIFRTNALPLSAVDDQKGICLEACRLNHACDNNCVKSWNEQIKRHTVHALRDIHAGEELTVNYLGSMRARDKRTDQLLSRFNFTCSCGICSLPQGESQENDQQLEEIYFLDQLVDLLGVEGIVNRPQKMLAALDRQLSLYQSQNLHDSGKARCFFDAGQVMIVNGDQARAHIFFEKAISEWRAMLGSDSNEVLEYTRFVDAPSQYPLYNRSTRWGTRLEDVPRTLDAVDFDNWLWRRPVLQEPGQHVDMRNRIYFPGFQDLPAESLPDPEYHQLGINGTKRPRRHWCFLGEIVEITMLLRLSMQVRDINGKTLPVVFYTSGRGEEIPSRLRKKGFTIAIMYATQRAFTYDEPGIRLEDDTFAKVLHAPLDKLLALNDELQFSQKNGPKQLCHGCGKGERGLKPCGGCLFVKYCGEECQRLGWATKDHRFHCKLLRDAELRSLLSRNWEEHQGHIRFVK